MKNRNSLGILVILSAALLTIGAARAQAQIAPQAISFAPVGVAGNQTLQLNLVNIDQPNGIFVKARILDISGRVLAQSFVQLSYGKTTTIKFKPSAAGSRTEVRADFQILTPQVTEASVRRSQEVFDDATGVSRIVMGGGGTSF